MKSTREPLNQKGKREVLDQHPLVRREGGGEKGGERWKGIDTQ